MNNNINKLAIIDFDETLIKGQSQRLLINFFYKKGYLSAYKYVILMTWFLLFKFNFFVNLKSIFEFATSSIKNIKVSELEAFFDEFFENICIPLIYNDSRQLVNFLRENNYHLLLVSTAIDPIIIRARNYLKFDEMISTQLEISNGVYTGKIVGNPVFGNNKSILVNQYINSSKFASDDLCVMADHFSDIPLLLTARIPVVVNPSNELWKYAKTKDWPVLYLDDNESFQYFKSHTVF